MELKAEIREEYIEKCRKAWENFEKNYTMRFKALRQAMDKRNVNFRNEKLMQKEIASFLEIHPQNYNKIETGKLSGGNNPTLEHIIKLSTIYGCSTDYLLCLEESKGSYMFAAEEQAKYQSTMDQVELLKDKVKVLKDALEAEKRLNALLTEKLAS